MPPKKPNPKNSIGSYDGKCTALATEADNFVGANAAGLTEGGMKRAAMHVEDLRNQFARMDKRWEDDFKAELEANDPGLHDELEARVVEAGNRVKKAVEVVLELMDKPVLTAVAANGGAGGSGARAVPPSRSTPKMDTSFKPEVLTASSTLEEYNGWESNFLAHMDSNRDFLAASTDKMKQKFFTSLLDSKIQAAIETDKAVTEAIPITSVVDANLSLLKWLRAYILRHSPLYMRRYQYSLCKQMPKESFQDFWCRKELRAKECELETIDAEAVQITELIIGIRDVKLREACLKTKDPTLADLVALGIQFDLAAKVAKDNFGSEVSVNKTSDYQNLKKGAWSAAKDSKKTWTGNAGKACKICGRDPCRKDPCPGLKWNCSNCGKKGHGYKVCKQPRSERSANTTKSDEKATTKTVKVKVVTSKKDDCEPTPTCMMDFVTESGRKFSNQVLPDTGCSQSIVALDLVEANNMEIDKKAKKRIRNASDEPMACHGSVVFEVGWQGRRTEVVALVSSDLTQEVLLGWKTLKRLSIIPEDFPNISDVQCQRVIGCAKQSAGRTDQLAGRTDQSAGWTDQSAGRPKHFTKANLYLGKDPKANIEEAMAAFPVVFQEPSEVDGVLKTMKGGPMKIHLKDVPIIPTQLYTARKVPYAFEDSARAELDKLEKMGIIEKVEGASDWCSPISFVRKPGGGVRSVVDLKGLNKYVMRPTHPFPAGKDIIATIPPSSKVFAVFDCLKGYWQVPLDEDSRPLTTFLTEFGRYRYLRAPMGLNASGDEFCLRTDKAVAGITGVKKLVDDVLIFADNDEDLLDRIVELFKCCQEWGITLSKGKFQYGSSVKFAGFIVNSEGSKPDPEKVAAIKNFPVPKDMTNLKSFMGLVNQFSSFSPDLKHALSPLQPLLKKNNVYIWQPEHAAAFEAVKAILTKEGGPVLAHFDPKLPVTLFTDASRTGLGFILTQKDEEDHTRLIQCGSRFLSPAEKNYAVIELEAMGIQWAILNCRKYLLGVDFVVKTDHKPLLGVINGRDLDSVNNARLQRILSKLLGYQFVVEYLPGKLNDIADALSRAPIFQPDQAELCDVLVQTMRVESCDPQLESIVKAALDDTDYQKVIEAVSTVLDPKTLPATHPARLYRNQWAALAFEKDVGLLSLYGRVVVPRAVQRDVLRSLHIQHTGQLKTYKNAKQLYFWPQMSRDIKEMVSNCPECVAYLPSNPLPPLVQTEALRPFEAMSADLGKLDGDDYLVVVDRFSGWPNVAKLKKLDTTAITDQLEDWHLDFGKPKRLRTDGGPQFRSQFIDWCESQGIVHEKSSPEHHESNGHAEVAVKHMKYLLGKTGSWKEFRRSLHEWRNTPRSSDGLSPAQWAWGRRQRSEAPALASAYNRISDQEIENALNKRGEVLDKVKQKFDKNRKSKSVLLVGTEVIMQDKRDPNGKTGRWRRRGTIVEKKKHGNTYVIEANGYRYLRSRLFLRPVSGQEVVPEAAALEELEPEAPARVELRRSKRERKQA